MSRIFILSAFLFLLGCDKCKDVVCENGTCEEGVCHCDEYYEGDQCSYQRDPERILIQSVTMSNISSVFYGGYYWDISNSIDSLPDIALHIQAGIDKKNIYESEQVFENTTALEFHFYQGFPVVIEKLDDVLRFGLVDIDRYDQFQEFFWATSRLYIQNNGFPSSLEIEYVSGFTLKLELEYEF